ncbi:MAG: 50S ribosomal protein L11 methyltransferase, partial [Lachnospiraceae bacterium]|nr:50S ribosomal protein L11 methyltransferase [Lachnospiraceae bacterium]
DNYKFIYGFGNIICDSKLRKIVGSEKYDIIVANILAPVLISLIEQGNIGSFLVDGGSLVLSGIIKEKLNDVLDSIRKSKCFNDINYEFEDEWAVITCKKGVRYE